ncbi:MAG: class I SAM-dependent methyltransferase [Pseudomonadota bacterium]
MADQDTISVYDDQIEAYANMITDEKPGAHHKEFMASLPEGGYLLDLGCGPGNSSAIFHKAGFKVDAVDASSEMVNHARQVYEIDARLGTFDELTKENIYDGVWASFSLLHAARKDFQRHLLQIQKSLKPGGSFYIGMKLGNSEKRDRLGRFYSYYEKPELLDYLSAAGFKSYWIKEGEEKGLAGDIAPWIMVLSSALTAKSSD